jgi:hypothetical protein
VDVVGEFKTFLATLVKNQKGLLPTAAEAGYLTKVTTSLGAHFSSFPFSQRIDLLHQTADLTARSYKTAFEYLMGMNGCERVCSEDGEDGEESLLEDGDWREESVQKDVKTRLSVCFENNFFHYFPHLFNKRRK